MDAPIAIRENRPRPAGVGNTRENGRRQRLTTHPSKIAFSAGVHQDGRAVEQEPLG